MRVLVDFFFRIGGVLCFFVFVLFSSGGMQALEVRPLRTSEPFHAEPLSVSQE